MPYSLRFLGCPILFALLWRKGGTWRKGRNQVNLRRIRCARTARIPDTLTPRLASKKRTRTWGTRLVSRMPQTIFSCSHALMRSFIASSSSEPPGFKTKHLRSFGSPTITVMLLLLTTSETVHDVAGWLAKSGVTNFLIALHLSVSQLMGELYRRI